MAQLTAEAPVQIETDQQPDQTTEELTVDTLIEDVSIDGMCGVY